jgi:hypothetical protein
LDFLHEMNAQIGLKEIHGFGDNEEISGNTTQHPAQKCRAVLPIRHGVKREPTLLQASWCAEE